MTDSLIDEKFADYVPRGSIQSEWLGLIAVLTKDASLSRIGKVRTNFESLASCSERKVSFRLDLLGHWNFHERL